MKQLLLISFCIFFLSACASHLPPAQDAVTELWETDEKATALAPWEPGEIVAGVVFLDLVDRPYQDKGDYRIWVQPDSTIYSHISVLSSHFRYRVFLGVTVQRHYVVQEYYSLSGTPETDSYIVVAKRLVTEYDLTRVHSTPYDIPIVNSPLVFRYPNGQKLREYPIQCGMIDGVVTEWYMEGKMAAITIYKQGHFFRRALPNDNGKWTFYKTYRI